MWVINVWCRRVQQGLCDNTFSENLKGFTAVSD
jgi:hypothetical protein